MGQRLTTSRCAATLVALWLGATSSHAGMGPVPPDAPGEVHAAPSVGARPSAPAASPRPMASPDSAVPLGRPPSAIPRPQANAAPRTDALAVGSSVLQTASALAIVLALIAGVAFTAKRLARRSGGLLGALGAGGRAPSGLLEVIGRYPVGRGTTLILLKLDRRILLLSQTGGKGLRGGPAVTTLCEISDTEDVASILMKARDDEGDSMARRFQAVLGQADRAAAEALRPTPPPSPPARARHLPAPVRTAASTKVAHAAQAAAAYSSRQSAPGSVDSIRHRLDTLRAAQRPVGRVA